MPVIGLDIRSIEAKREAETVGAVKVKTNTDLKEVREHNLTGLGIPALSIGFEFRTIYVSDDDKRSLAKIIISGEILFTDKKNKEIFEKWKKDKSLPEDVNIQVINAVLDKCSKKALIISDDLQLPPPIALPFARKKQ